MKVLHLPYTWAPEPVGGTEVYVADLVAQLKQHGIESRVAVPVSTRAGPLDPGTRVYRLPLTAQPDIADIYGRFDAASLNAFAEVLADFRPDIVHFHSLTAASSAEMAELAAERSRLVVTYHTPTFSCLRGDLRYHGGDVCDGVLNVTRCSECILARHGLPTPAAKVLSRVPTAVGRAIAQSSGSRRVSTPIRMRELVAANHRSFLRTIEAADLVMAFARWTQQLLIDNGLDPDRIRMVRHGVSASTGTPAMPAQPPLRLVFAGRADPLKGLQTLLDALATVPGAPVTLDVLSQVTSPAVRPPADRRIRWHKGPTTADVRSSFSEAHMVAVPSLTLETGPLVLLEAFATGRPVLGSRLGGIAEHITHGVDGLLLKPGAPQDWADAIGRLASQPTLVAQLASGVKAPTSGSDAASDVLAVYRELSATTRSAARSQH